MRNHPRSPPLSSLLLHTVSCPTFILSRTRASARGAFCGRGDSVRLDSDWILTGSCLDFNPQLFSLALLLHSLSLALSPLSCAPAAAAIAQHSHPSAAHTATRAPTDTSREKTLHLSSPPFSLLLSPFFSLLHSPCCSSLSISLSLSVSLSLSLSSFSSLPLRHRRRRRPLRSLSFSLSFVHRTLLLSFSPPSLSLSLTCDGCCTTQRIPLCPTLRRLCSNRRPLTPFTFDFAFFSLPHTLSLSLFPATVVFSPRVVRRRWGERPLCTACASSPSARDTEG